MFCLIINNEIAFGPCSWSKYVFQVKIQELCNIGYELPDNLLIPLNITPNIKILPTDIDIPHYNEKIQQLVGPLYDIQDDCVNGHYELDDKPIEVVQNELIDKCAAIRWEREIQGITISINDKDLFISTNRGERDIFLQTYQCMSDEVDWKFGDDWVKLTKTDLQTIVTAIFNHIQGVFVWEQQKQQEIKTAATLADLDNIDIS